MMSSLERKPLLTIAIPTWNRASYLRLNLNQLAAQIDGLELLVEILISDNCSSDETSSIVENYIKGALPIKYVRNATNIGSDCNIAQCFNLASGHYVMILGDDDLLVDGALPMLLRILKESEYGVVSVRPYGYEDDFRREYPGGKGEILGYCDVGEFVKKLGVFSTLISANIISKNFLTDEDARIYCGTNLVHTQLLYRAAIAAERNLWVDRYLVACKRNNSGGYIFSEVFVDNFGAILDELRGNKISEAAIAQLERRLLMSYYPFYILRQRMVAGEDLEVAWRRFYTRYSSYSIFWLCIAPILRLPRPLALIWGAVVLVIGRSLDGDFLRGVKYMLNRITNRLFRNSV